MSGTNYRSAILIFICLIGVHVPLFAAGDQIHVIAESELKHWWQADPASPNRPGPYPVEALKAGVEGCIAVAFEIKSDGSVSNERIWLDKLPRFPYRKAMERSVLLSVHQWHFIPSLENAKREAVYTYQTLTYTLTGSNTNWTSNDQQREQKLKAECEMPGFPQQIQAMISAKAHAAGDHP